MIMVYTSAEARHENWRSANLYLAVDLHPIPLSYSPPVSWYQPGLVATAERIDLLWHIKQ